MSSLLKTSVIFKKFFVHTQMKSQYFLTPPVERVFKKSFSRRISVDQAIAERDLRLTPLVFNFLILVCFMFVC